LKGLRDRLDHIDSEIVRFIAERYAIVAEVVASKAGRSDTIRDPGREREVLARVEARARQVGLSGPLVRKIFADIIAHSVAVQATTISGGADRRKVTVALQGGPFSYDHLAAEQYMSGRGVEAAYPSFDSIGKAVRALLDGAADIVFLPIENTFAGSINEVYDLLREHDLNIVGEETYRIDHCLVGPADVPLPAIERVYGHPKIIEQCSAFLESMPQASAVATHDTTAALRLVAEAQNPALTALAAPQGAAAHDLAIIRRGVGNHEDIQTRFVALARDPLRVDPRVPCKTSLILVTRHEHGALLKCLQILSDFGVSLTKLESRPRRNRPWEYMFFIDFDGHVELTNVVAALDALRAQALYLKILGCYPAKATPEGAEAARIGRRTTTEGAPPIASVPQAPPAASVRRSFDIHGSGRGTDMAIRVGDILIGSGGFTVMAGPPLVASREQIDTAARFLRDHGAHVLRAGVFASGDPAGGTGAGMQGLEWLAAAGRAHRLSVMTEVNAIEQVRPVAERADILAVGARNMQNFALLAELGKIDKPVVLNRGVSSTIDEWLASAEFIVSHGNGQVVLCERGIRTFESGARSTLDLSAVLVVRERTHLPVVVDPSQGTDKRAHVTPMAMAARACGAHGVLVDVALNADGPPDDDHDLGRSDFETMMAALAKVVP
jgi:chorismate mutase/prephenate dehydratase